MYIQAQGHRCYCYTGGKPFNPNQPTVVFIHGVLSDHSVWAWQSRYFAHHGWNVLAVDLPGHGKSAGPAPTSVASAAGFIRALLDALAIEQAALVGHSWGSLIALEAAALLAERASHLALIGTAFPMKVSPALLASAQQTPEKAMAMVQQFSRATLAPPLAAGAWVHGAGMALGRQLLARNPQENVFQQGFIACDSYENGLQAMGKASCPTLFVLGTQDQMTPPKAAQSLIDTARATGKTVTIELLNTGHNHMSETPEAVLLSLCHFLQQS